MTRALGVAATIFAVVLLSTSAPVRAQPAGACDQAYEKGQELRRNGRLIEAREQFVHCADASCPRFEVTDCSRWSVDVGGTIASIIVRVRTPQGAEVTDSLVTVDGQPRQAGSPVEVDPGGHVVKVERAASSSAIAEVKVAAGEKNHEVVLTLDAAAASSPPPSVSSPPPAVPGPDHTLAYVVGGGGLAAVVAGSVLDVHGYFVQTLPLQSCSQAMNCNAQQKDQGSGARTELLVGDVVLGVGLATVAVAVWLFVHPPKAAGRSTGDAPWLWRF